MQAVSQLVQTDRPVCPEGGAVFNMLACGLCGTDVDKIKQLKVGAVLGHEFVGELAQLSPQARQEFPHLKIGQRYAIAHHIPCGQCYYCDHDSPSMCRQFKATNFDPGGFAQAIAVSGLHLAHTTFELKPATPTEAGCLIEPLACCLRAVDRLDTRTGNSTLVVGLGSFGVLTALSANYRGHKVVGFDINATRVTQVYNYYDSKDIEIDWVSTLEALSPYLPNAEKSQLGFDNVILCVVNEKTVELAFSIVREGGQIILLAGSQAETPLIPQNLQYFKEINVLASYSPSLIHLKEANDLVQNNLLPLDLLLQNFYPLALFENALEDYLQAKILKAIITP